MDPGGDPRGPDLTPANTTPSASDVESRYFDRLVRERGDFDPFAPRGWRTIARRYREMARPAAAIRLLDVGCGTGQSRQIYDQAGVEYHGIDLSFEALTVARGKGRRGAWQQADACCLPFADASFDVVAFSSVLHHIPERHTALREAWRVLRPDGSVFAFDPNLRHPAMALFRWPRSPLYIAEGVSPNESPLPPGKLRREFQEAGFTQIVQRCQSDIPYRYVAPRAIRALLACYNLADRAFEWSGLGRWFGTFVVTSGRRMAASGSR